MGMLNEEFAQLQDHRRANSSYELADVLRSVFAMFSLKTPSLLAFNIPAKGFSTHSESSSLGGEEFGIVESLRR